jgi:hypothetical protein
MGEERGVSGLVEWAGLLDRTLADGGQMDDSPRRDGGASMMNCAGLAGIATRATV